MARAVDRFREMPLPWSRGSVRRGVRVRQVLDGRTFRAVSAVARPFAAGRFGGISFLVAVIVPTLVVGLYLALFSKDQYRAEMRLAVRGNVEKLAGAEDWGYFGFLIRLNNNQESLILATYIRSRAMIERVEKRLDLRTIFNRPRLDVWARLGSDPTIDDFERYWQRMVDVSVQAISGIVTVQVRAFTPADALAILEAVRVESEDLVNELSDRTRADTMASAERRLVAEAADLSDVRLSFQRYRGEQGVIDAGAAAKGAVDDASDLEKERIRRATELAAARQTLDADAPSLRHLGPRIQAIDDSLANVRRGTPVPGDPNAAGASPHQRLKYDWLTVQNDMSEHRVKSAETALDRARADLDKQQVFLSVFSPPALPERPSFPNRGKALLTALIGSFVIWSLGKLSLASVRDHDS
jgi:capsular polysaccharide transport system permease protein